MNIREFTPNDYEGMVVLWNACYPEHPETAEESRHHDETREAKYRWNRFVAEDNGRIVGTGHFNQHGGMYHPQKFEISIGVLPGERGSGIGSRLYERVVEALAPYDPIRLSTFVREDHPDALRFAQKRGFVEAMRNQESKLDVASFDPAPFAADVRRAGDAGIVIRTYPELAATTADEKALRHEMYELAWTISQDIPHPDEQTRRSFEEWEKRFTNPGFIPEAQFYALDGDKMVGATMLWGNQATPDLTTGMTGVLRDYRGKGIATALKVRALTWAKERGTPYVRTWNEANNTGMLNINFRLGFIKQPAWLDMAKEI